MYLEEAQAQDMCREKASIHMLGNTFRRYCLGSVSRLLGDMVTFVQNVVSFRGSESPNNRQEFLGTSRQFLETTSITSSQVSSTRLTCCP
jgi:hypothetical protein